MHAIENLKILDFKILLIVNNTPGLLQFKKSVGTYNGVYPSKLKVSNNTDGSKSDTNN